MNGGGTFSLQHGNLGFYQSLVAIVSLSKEMCQLLQISPYCRKCTICDPKQRKMSNLIKEVMILEGGDLERIK